MLEASIFKTIAVQTPAFALIGVLLFILVRFLMQKLNQRDERLDKVTDGFHTVVTNHLHESKDSSQKLTQAIQELRENVKENTEFTRHAIDRISK